MKNTNNTPMPIFPELENVFYESPFYPFDDLNEAIFIKMIFSSLNQLMKAEFMEYEFYILSSGWEQDKLPESVSYMTNKKKVLIYISDNSGNVPYYLSPYYFAIFKVHLQLGKFLVNNIFNFPLGYVKNVPKFPVLNITERKFSVFFSGNLNRNRLPFFFNLFFAKNPVKIIKKGIEILIKIKFLKNLFTIFKFDFKFSNSYIRFTNGFKKGISPEKYGEIISDSKIVLCPKGFNLPECFRHYEAMRAGCVIISEKLPPTHFYSDSPIIQIQNWKDGFDIINKLLKDDVELVKKSGLTLEWWEKRCSEEATAQYIIDCIKKLS